MIVGLLNDLLVIGVSKENVEHLEEGDPIHVGLVERLAITNQDHAQVKGVLVFYGATEDECVRILRERGLINEHTTVLDDRRRKR